MRIFTGQTNFTAGEISPRMMGRVDVSRYANGAQKIENAFVIVQGGARRRYGSRYLAMAKGGAVPHRLIRYVFSLDVSFVLELGDHYLRVFDAQSGSVVLDSGMSTLELVTPYAANEIAAITTKHTASLMYLFHPDHPTYELRRISSTLWSLQATRWEVEPFAELGHIPDAKLLLGSTGIGSGVTFTTSAVSLPDAPTSPVATARESGASVSVTAPVNNGGAAIDYYTATSSPGGFTGTSTNPALILVAGLSNGTVYTFTVTAHNKLGSGAASAASNSVTPSAGLPGSSLTVTVTPSPFSASVGNDLQYINGPTASSSNGTGPFTTVWTKLSGSEDLSIDNGTLAQLRLASINYRAPNYGTFRATMTDSIGAKGSFDVNVTVFHNGSGSGGGL